MRPNKHGSGRCSRRATCRLENAHLGGGIFLQLRRGAYRPRDEITPTVGTNAMQARLNTIATEGALVRANHGFSRVGREILVAALAVGAQLKHEHLTERDRNPTHWAVSDVLVNPS